MNQIVRALKSFACGEPQLDSENTKVAKLGPSLFHGYCALQWDFSGKDAGRSSLFNWRPSGIFGWEVLFWESYIKAGSWMRRWPPPPTPQGGGEVVKGSVTLPDAELTLRGGSERESSPSERQGQQHRCQGDTIENEPSFPIDYCKFQMWTSHQLLVH